MDKKSELYFQITPYAYAANTPTNAIDPDGHIVIFINGNHYGEGGSSRYWRQIEKTTNRYDELGHREKYAFDKAVMRQVGDNHAMYVDGAGSAIKGYHPFSTLLSPGLSGVGADDRRVTGYEEGSKKAAAIIESLHRTGGVIDESIKIITHSMGGAYGKGYVKAILDYAKKNNIAGVKIAFEADFAPFQSDKQKALDGVLTLQFSHNDDMVAGNAPMPGAQKMNTSFDKQQGHSIFGFADQIKNLPAGKYRVVGGKLVPDN